VLGKVHRHSFGLPAYFSRAFGGSSANIIKSASVVDGITYGIDALSPF